MLLRIAGLRVTRLAVTRVWLARLSLAATCLPTALLARGPLVTLTALTTVTTLATGLLTFATRRTLPAALAWLVVSLFARCRACLPFARRTCRPLAACFTLFLCRRRWRLGGNSRGLTLLARFSAAIALTLAMACTLFAAIAAPLTTASTI